MSIRSEVRASIKRLKKKLAAQKRLLKIIKEEERMRSDYEVIAKAFFDPKRS